MPVKKGETVIRLVVEKPPSGGVNKQAWLWWSGTGVTAEDVDRCWQSFLRRFDLPPAQAETRVDQVTAR